jgi:nucleotide-binding universal stress UspA family protein
VVVGPSTPEGLCRLVEELRADIVVFGSDYRTPPGRVAPQHTTQSLLECGPAAVAIAPAEYFGARIHRIGVISIPGDDTTLETARALADSFGASLTRDERQVDMLVVGSRLEAPLGHVLLSAQAQNEIENARCPVLVVPRGVSIDFPAVLAHAA